MITLVLAALFSSAHAAPMTIAHSARLLDPAGGPVQGPVNVEIRLYDQATGGAELWANSFQTTAQNGYVNLTLRDGTPTLGTSVFDHAQVWLEMQVGSGSPLSPRTQLSSVPYALSAGQADVADLAEEALYALEAGIAEEALYALEAGEAEEADRVDLDIGEGGGSCTDGMLGLNPETSVFRVCHNSAWVEVAGGGGPLGTAENPALSCQEILAADPAASDASYWIDSDGTHGQAAIQLYCDMHAGQGWALVYSMCQNSTGSIQAISHSLPVLPTSSPNPASVPYAQVNAMNPSQIRFTSTFTGGTGYLYSWGTATASPNLTEVLLNGLTRNINSCQTMGAPQTGSTGFACSNMSWQHNNGGGETHDIPTLGCGCAVWAIGGETMAWGQIDILGNYNGVSHRTSGTWNHTPQTTTGCILAYVR